MTGAEGPAVLSTRQALRAAFAEVIELFRFDPLGMLGVVLLRVFDGRDAAGVRLERILRKHGAR